jgi:hypothetical protein
LKLTEAIDKTTKVFVDNTLHIIKENSYLMKNIQIIEPDLYVLAKGKKYSLHVTLNKNLLEKQDEINKVIDVLKKITKDMPYVKNIKQNKLLLEIIFIFK